jgi:hypothetical protein
MQQPQVIPAGDLNEGSNKLKNVDRQVFSSDIGEKSSDVGEKSFDVGEKLRCRRKKP